ncbi:KEX1 protease precursor [Dothidotthia symphoricarpi CBS 119687]|uniref:KEX1 protease n=1 Tax=Dothidotthia symphoricarpi CBS 119687 TaxID=1392245 RepID=A0A6A6AN63_9PLEO|nr:KEX1 protease precursor [Dothidotthia symphoricarpi CBS 119687]KAF2132623.1 KEX1 protease precursor [Dothidotthia symphoricarpi CBS 119687]
MRILTIWSLLSAATLAAAGTHHLPARNYTTHDYYAVHLSPSASPTELAAHLGLTYEGPFGSLDHHHVFKAPKHDHDIVDDARQELKRRRRKRQVGDEHHPLDHIRFTQKQKLKPRHWKRNVIPKAKALPSVADAIKQQREAAKTLDIHDPIFEEQWHIFNVKTPGNDINVTNVWMQGFTGKGVTTCIVDDGLDYDSADLKDNFFAEGSYDFNDHENLPTPKLSDDRHGTRCAGEVAAGRNNACGVGLAYDAKISGVRILSGEITDMDEALAINYEMQKNDIYSCSWGPPDDGKTMQAPGILIEKAMVTAVQQGRDGKGSIYVFAAGNGASSDDNCNFDGYTNSIYSITVGAIDKNDQHPYYSEACSAQLVVTYSSGGGDAIHTTDVGANKCTAQHGGTSAAGPIGVGVFALLLQARPELTWRDVQWLTVLTAVQFEETSDWQKTALDRMFSHQYGYGKLDAWAIVEKAKDWKLVKPQAWFWSPWMHVKKDIPEGTTGLASTFEVTADMLKEANFARVEHITLTMNVKHQRRGDLSVDLISPAGMVSHLATARRDDTDVYGYADWTFMSVAHWGEAGVGNWTVLIKDTLPNNSKKGVFTDWKLRLWGESIDSSKAKLLPIPTEHDDDDHDKIDDHPAHETSVSIPTGTRPTMTAVPSDHPDRPINQKPSQTPSPSAQTTASESATPTSAAENFLPNPFPTFGVSKRTQIWIYGALSLILIFIAGLGAFLFVARRKRMRDSRDSYEFAVLDDVEDREDAGMLAGGAKKRARRGGELYDAFAGESDEDLLSGDEEGDEGPYRDRERGGFSEKGRGRGDSGDSGSESEGGKRQ